MNDFIEQERLVQTKLNDCKISLKFMVIIVVIYTIYSIFVA